MYAETSDRDLIDKSIVGDKSAFEELVRRYQIKVYTVAYRFMGNQADAADLAQEAFLKIYKSLGSFRGEASFLTWIYHITANLCRDHLRKRRDYLPLNEMRSEPLSINRPVSDYTNPDQVVEQKELSSNLQKMLGLLNDEHRIILVMREIQGFAYEEIASQLDCTMGTVKSRLSRARHALKEQVLAHRELFSDRLPKGREGVS